MNKDLVEPDVPAEDAAPAGDAAAAGDAPAAGEPARSSRAEALPEAVGRLRIGRGRLNLNERILMIIGGILAPIGILAVVLGWWGAARTPNLYEQIPYLISGGLLGIALVFLGAFFYFTHWVTQLVKEHRAQSALVVAALARLDDSVRTAVPAASNGHRPPDDEEAAAAAVPLVATARGTMAHRLDCAVVKGKPSLREVSADEGLLPCKLCDPYSTQ